MITLYVHDTTLGFVVSSLVSSAYKLNMKLVDLNVSVTSPLNCLEAGYYWVLLSGYYWVSHTVGGHLDCSRSRVRVLLGVTFCRWPLV